MKESKTKRKKRKLHTQEKKNREEEEKKKKKRKKLLSLLPNLSCHEGKQNSTRLSRVQQLKTARPCVLSFATAGKGERIKNGCQYYQI